VDKPKEQNSVEGTASSPEHGQASPDSGLTPLHLGLTPWNFHDMSAASLCDQAQFAEAQGYQSIWVPENHFGPQAIPDPLMLLASIAGATQSIRLGTTSFLLTLRNPLQAAEQVVVLDRLSGGRLMLGVGRGYAPEMLRAYHVPVAQKRKIFAWTLDLMKRAWMGEAITLDENPDNAVEVHPRPIQQPHPPIWVAAFGPKALAQAGRLGLPYLSSPMESMSTLEQNYAQHRFAAEEEGVAKPSDVPLMRTVFVSKEVRQIEKLRQLMLEQSENSRLGEGETLDDWTIIGEPSYVRERVDEYRQRLGMTHLIATRIRVAGLEEVELRGSVALLAETLGGL
jgi:alkanesulfonate monooxygenase SsuD/methylene tetrahydromethanopterin reductase-like flavin-dependent oxidoreductase (luciferase family)|tara:strand:- start:1108 stop:2124 length:1017 start_codon:yes stop_codon:yes gene_type:complete